MNRPSQKHASRAIRVAVAAPFPEIVQIHESAAEYADELEVCAMISNPDAVLEQARLLQPDVLLLSDELGPARPDTLARLTAIAPAARLVMLATGSAAARPFIADAVVRLGAPAAELRAVILAAVEDVSQPPPAHSRSRGRLATDTAKPAPARSEAPSVTVAIATSDGSPGEAPAERPPARIVLVLGGKGGVGKSIVAVNLSTLLAQRGSSVVVVDLDLQYGDVGVLLNLEAHRITIDGLAERGEAVDPAVLEEALATSEHGVRALLAPTSPESSDLVSAVLIEAILNQLSRSHDYVVVDSPAHIEERVVAAMEIADEILVVSSFGITSVKDAKVTLRLLQSLGVEPGRVALVVNQTHERAGAPAEEIARAVRFPILSTLPYEPRMEESVDSGRPLVVAEPRSGFSKQLSVVVEHVARARAPISAPVVRRDAARWRLRFGR